MFHVLSERGLTAEYPVAYQIGSGIKGRTYAVQVGDYLLESPLSWYQGSAWDVSPGFESMQLLDFDRPITANCLFCHAGRAKFSDADGRRLDVSGDGGRVEAITCERCHGDGETHVRRPSAKNIVNPGQLSGAARDSVCEQCHLEGETRILNPGKTLDDYRPGDPLEKTMVTYLFQRANAEKPAVSQVEELAESKCAPRQRRQAVVWLLPSSARISAAVRRPARFRGGSSLQIVPCRFIQGGPYVRPARVHQLPYAGQTSEQYRPSLR